MTKISSSQFKQDFSQGVKNDAATQERLDKALGEKGAGKKLLDAADTNKSGDIKGQELDTLFKKLDDFDKDGSRQTISGEKPLGAINALKAPPPPPAPTGPQAPAGPGGLYDEPTTLAKGAKGPEVTAQQEKLVKLGYDVGKNGPDGDFGPTTKKAVEDFQRDNKMTVTGELDAATQAKLDTAPPNPAKVQFPEYGKMFKDGVMQTTLGVGFDEDGNDIGLRKDLLKGLDERGFKPISEDEKKEMAKKGIDIDPNATYFTKDFQHDGKDVKALVKLVDRDSPDAKEQFAKGMKNDDLILYTGHGRMGSGPDFDHANSSKGNYVIGAPAEQGHYKLGKNDVKKEGALKDDYQLMFFDACNTKWYVDDLRSVKNKTEGNLDVVASNRELPWSTSKDDVLGMLDGVMGGKSIQDIKGGLDKQNQASGTGPAFRADGFKGNEYRPPSN